VANSGTRERSEIPGVIKPLWDIFLHNANVASLPSLREEGEGELSADFPADWHRNTDTALSAPLRKRSRDAIEFRIFRCVLAFICLRLAGWTLDNPFHTQLSTIERERERETEREREGRLPAVTAVDDNVARESSAALLILESLRSTEDANPLCQSTSPSSGS